MRKRVWVVSPLFYLMAVGMLVMSIISYRYNRILFAIELTVSVLAVVAVLVGDLILLKHIIIPMGRAKRTLRGEDSSALEKFPLPVAVVAEAGDVIWGNEAFRTELSKNEQFIGQNIQQFIYPKTLRQVIAQRGTAVFHKDRDYTVYGVKTGNSYILYFIDDTYYKQIVKEYKERRTVVCLAAFDNREEIARDSVSGEEGQIVAKVEGVLRDWSIKELGGFVQKLRNDRYLILTDEFHLELAKKDRFRVMDQVREIKSESKMSATVSIGIGREARDIAESERKAHQALDMALGRGGDQVAVMQKEDTFEFFGGLSKGVEKRDKVRTRVIAASIADQVKASDRVFVMGHKNSDLDSVGAAVGMWAVIFKGLEKPVNIVVNENQTLAGQLIVNVEQAYPQEHIFIEPSAALQMLTASSLLVVVDTHAMDFVESRELVERSSRVIVIDHHRMMVTHIKNARIFYHEPYASSASEMVAEIVQYIKSSSVGPIEAQAMMAGICLDTKNFVIKTGVRTFEASAFLRRRGADTVAVKRLFANTLEAYKEKSQLVQNAEIYKQCAISMSSWGVEGDLRVVAAQAADELLLIQGVKASFVLYKNEANVNISARSLGDVNVQILLEGFGGGGHFSMAGAQIQDITLTQARKLLIQELDEKLENVTAQDNFN